MSGTKRRLEVEFCCLGGRETCRLWRWGCGGGISVLHIEESRGQSAGVGGGNKRADGKLWHCEQRVWAWGPCQQASLWSGFRFLLVT